MRFGPRTFHALASPHRLAILRALRDRPHTGSELVRVLGLSDTAVRKHLDVLEGAGLVTRRQEGRPWTYHELTPDARSLLESPPEGTRMALVGTLLATVAGFLAWQWSIRRPEPLPPGTMGSPAPPDPLLAWFFWATIVAAVLAGTVLGAFAWWRVMRRE